jgi:hypothetical protein
LDPTCQIFPQTAEGSTDQSTLQLLIEAIRTYRVQCASCLFQIYLPFPLVLSQLVTILTYIYVLITVLAQQDIYQVEGAEELQWEPVFYFPFFTCLEALVYIGALRVGQIYTNPLGNNDDDYEIVSFFNRNLRLAHVYGLYGEPSEKNSGVVAPFDLHHRPPPLEDLTGIQTGCMGHIPVHFYEFAHSKTGVFGAPSDAGEEPASDAVQYGGRKSRMSSRDSTNAKYASDLDNDISRPFAGDGSISS